MMKDRFNWDLLKQFNETYYKDVINISDVEGEEIAIMKVMSDTLRFQEYFFVCKRGKESYLLPSEALPNLPIIIKETQKIAYKGKAYLKIIKSKSLKIIPEQTMSYKEKIDNFCNYKHEKPDLFTLHKIIVDTLVSDRINIRCISYPSWGKDSPLTSLILIRGDCVKVNKPSIAKLKYCLNTKPRFLELDEVQGLKEIEKDDLSKFYEGTGDFNPYFINPSRGKDGIAEKFDMTNTSTITNYNFPDYSKGEVNETIFDWVFNPKVKSRIFPVLYEGGSHEVGACLESFKDVDPITQEDINFLVKFMKADLYYEKFQKSASVEFVSKYTLPNTRWDKNHKRIIKRINLYADGDKDLFDKFDRLLMYVHLCYLDFVNGKKIYDKHTNLTQESHKEAGLSHDVKEVELIDLSNDEAVESPKKVYSFEMLPKDKQITHENLNSIGFSDMDIQKGITLGDIFTVKPSVYMRL